MTKKLIIMGILMIPFLLLTRMATAQNYEVPPAYDEMPKEVQAQMNTNKANGESLYKNVVAKFVVGTTGLESSEYAELKRRAGELKQIYSVSIDSQGNVTIIMDGSYGFVTVKSIFGNLVSSLTSINGIYSVKK